MALKKCSKCGEIKQVFDFYKDKNCKDGYRYYCKECESEYYKQNYKPKPIKLRFCEVCNKKFKPNSGVQKYCSGECYKKQYKKLKKKYQQENKERINIKKQKYYKQRRKRDINYRIKCNLRHRIYLTIKNNTKSKHTMFLLGCSIDELKKYIESLFKPGMTWENYGKWHIDHIKPCCSFDLTKESEQKNCFHYTNLQPLWASENISKGGRI